jgi:DNA-binding transcriptional MocR family regulator
VTCLDLGLVGTKKDLLPSSGSENAMYLLLNKITPHGIVVVIARHRYTNLIGVV